MTLFNIPGVGELPRGSPFTLDGIKYPANWLALATPEDLSDRGITVVEAQPPEPEPPTVGELADYAAKKRRNLANGSTIVDVGEGRTIAVWIDPESRGAILGLVVAAGMNPSLTTQWKGADGAFHTLNASEITALALGMMAFVQACFATEAAVLEAIANETVKSYEDIDAAAWPSGV